MWCPWPHNIQAIVVVCKCRAAAIFEQVASSAVACAADRSLKASTSGTRATHGAWQHWNANHYFFMTAAMTLLFRLKYLVFLIGRSVITVWWSWNFVVLRCKEGVWTEKLTSVYAANGAGTALWLFALETSMRARRFGVRIPAGHEIFLLSTASIFALEPAQPPIIGLLLLLLCGREENNIPSVPRALPFMFKTSCPDVRSGLYRSLFCWMFCKHFSLLDTSPTHFRSPLIW